MKTIYKITIMGMKGVFGETDLFYKTEEKAIEACKIYSILCDVTMPESLTIPDECAEDLLKKHSIFLTGGYNDNTKNYI